MAKKQHQPPKTPETMKEFNAALAKLHDERFELLGTIKKAVSRVSELETEGELLRMRFETRMAVEAQLKDKSK